MTICEPVSNGLGSDAFAILWDGKQLQGINGLGPAPAAWTPRLPEEVRRRREDAAQARHRFASVPGAVATWVALSERYGKLPFADLLAPAIEIAERGYLLPIVGRSGLPPRRNSARCPGSRKASRPGAAPRVGELFKFPSAAPALRLIAETKGRPTTAARSPRRSRASARRTAACTRCRTSRRSCWR